MDNKKDRERLSDLTKVIQQVKWQNQDLNWGKHIVVEAL